MCKTCDVQQRVCPDCYHTQPKTHGDVFRGEVSCDECGGRTLVVRKPKQKEDEKPAD